MNIEMIVLLLFNETKSAYVTFYSLISFGEREGVMERFSYGYRYWYDFFINIDVELIS